jgi:hypothetical protein
MVRIAALAAAIPLVGSATAGFSARSVRSAAVQ